MEKMTINQLKGIIGRITETIKEYQTEVIGLTTDMAKAAKKNDMKEIKWLNQRITRRFESINENETRLAEFQEELKKAEAVENAGKGFEVVIEFLEDLYKKDMDWLNDLKNMPASELKNETKSVKMIAQMSETEAGKLFKQDILIRFHKLVKSVKKKAGENIIDVKLQRNENNGLDGSVIGDKATVTLSTVLAGGYNVQRLHYRTLVK